jgi:hypothetical protein
VSGGKARSVVLDVTVADKSAAREPISGRFHQRGCEFILAVRSQAFQCLNKLTFRHAEIVDKELSLI